MRISAKIDYACRALFVLSLHWPNPTPLQIQEIVQKEKIPIKFLVHILIQLKQLGFIESTRGKKGGYILLKDPSQIRLSDIITNFDGALCDQHKKSDGDILNQVWFEIDQKVKSLLDQITMESICNREKNNAKIISYEI